MNEPANPGVLPDTPAANPPPAVPPAPEPIPPVQPEVPVIPPSKKRFPLKTVGVAALALLVLGGGVFGYNMMRERQQVESEAKVWKNPKLKDKKVNELDKKECDGPSNGGWLAWSGGRCHISGAYNVDNPGDKKNTENPNVNSTLSTEGSCEGTDGGPGLGKGYAWCDEFGFCNTTGKGCDQAAVEKGFTVTYGNCNGLAGKNPTEYYCEGDFFPVGCQKKDSIPTGAGWNGTTISGEFCGTIQVDVYGVGFCSAVSKAGCNGQEINPPGSPNPSPSPSPTLTCDTITSSPTAPKIGDQVTFTCAGSTAPAGATTLNYDYRYSIGGGAWQSMTTDGLTPAKGTLTISQTGSYKVQCRACGNISGATVCSPDWTSAAP